MRKEDTELTMLEVEGDTELHKAVKKGNLADFKLFFKDGLDLFKKNKDELTPLDIAIIEMSRSQNSVFRKIIEYSFQKALDFKLEDSIEKRCLSAIDQYSTEKDLADFLARKNTNGFLISNVLKIRNDLDNYPKIKALVAMKTVSALSTGFFGPSKTNLQQFHLLLEQGDLVYIEAFLKKIKINLNQEILNTETALDVAVRKQNFPLAHFLLKAGARKMSMQSMECLMANASKWPKEERRENVKALSIEDDAHDGNVNLALQRATLRKNLNSVIFWVRGFGADINFKGMNDCTPLHSAVMAGSTPIVSFLLKQGADPNLTETLFNFTPIYFAINQEHLEIVTLLLANGANPNGSPTPDKPVDYAIFKKSFKVLTLLVEKGGVLSFFQQSIILKFRPKKSSSQEWTDYSSFINLFFNGKIGGNIPRIPKLPEEVVSLLHEQEIAEGKSLGPGSH